MRWVPRIAMVALLFLWPSLAQARLRVIATTTDLAALAQEIGKNNIDVRALIPGDQDPHQPPAAYPSELKDRIDLLMVVGLELESGWLPVALLKTGHGKLASGSDAYFDASEGCDILEKPEGTADQTLGGNHPFGNPHYWLDPENGRIIARRLTARLTELDPAHSVEYQENLRQFETTLTDKEKQWGAISDLFKDLNVVGFHASWPYFASAFHFTVAGTIEPVPGNPPAGDRMGQIIQLIRDQRVSLILVESTIHSPLPEAMATASGAKAVVLASSVEGVPEVKTYFDLFDYDLQAIKEALGL